MGLTLKGFLPVFPSPLPLSLLFVALNLLNFQFQLSQTEPDVMYIFLSALSMFDCVTLHRRL